MSRVHALLHRPVGRVVGHHPGLVMVVRAGWLAGAYVEDRRCPSSQASRVLVANVGSIGGGLTAFDHAGPTTASFTSPS